MRDRVTKLLQWREESKDYFVAEGVLTVGFYSVSKNMLGMWAATAVSARSSLMSLGPSAPLGEFPTIEEAASACNDVHENLVKNKLLNREALKEEYR